MLVKEIVYACLDLAKAATSDDSFFTEEFAYFLCKKYRIFLIKKEQDKTKGIQPTPVDSEMQEICIDLEKVPAMDGEPCTGGYYLRSTEPIPKMLDGYQPRVYPIDFYQGSNITYISRDRMRYVGSNPYMKNIIYSSLGPDLHLYLNSSNPQFLYLKKLRISAVFDDFEAASKLKCDDEGASESCDPLDAEFPIREHLVPLLIEMVVKELVGAEYKPEDKRNNATDDLSKVNTK